MSKKFVMVCKNCKFLSGPYNGVDTWFSCDCGERCFLSSKDIRSGKWRKFNRSTIPKTWLMNDQPLVVQVLEPHILRAIRLQDYDLSDNEEEEDMDSVEDFDPERIADELENEYDSDDDEEDDSESDDDEEDEEDDFDSDEEDGEDEDDSDDDDSDYEHGDDDDDDDEPFIDDRTPEEIDEEYEERYRRKRNQH